MRLDRLDRRRLPGQSRLFLQYLYDFDQVAPLYPAGTAHTGPEALGERAEAARKRDSRLPREALVRMLLDFNARVGSGSSTLENIEKLRDPGTVAVVTGQQLGLFGGPALSVYKALTAVSLARILEAGGYAAVPVFWLPSDDSDFLESRSTAFFDPQGSLLPLGYSGPSPPSATMVGTVLLEATGDPLKRLQDGASVSEYREEVLRTLESAYAPGTFFTDAQGRWLARLFRNQGLILFDALHSGYKDALRPVFETAVVERKRLIRSLQARGRELEAEGHRVQVPVDGSESLLFWLEERRRYKLDFRSGAYWSRGSRSLRLPTAELLDRIRTGTGEFGPNVLLRPIIQDHLFPTVAYVGGPAEVAYFSQVGAISPFWKIQCCVFPRAGVTVVDRKSQRLLKKHSLDLVELLSLGASRITQRVARTGASKQVLDEFERVTDVVRESLTRLQGDIVRVDPSLGKMVPRAWKRVFYQMERVEKRFLENYRTRDGVAGRHLDHLQTRLHPQGKLQERVVNFNQFLMEEGPGFIDGLLETIDPFCMDHQVIHV